MYQYGMPNQSKMREIIRDRSLKFDSFFECGNLFMAYKVLLQSKQLTFSKDQ